MSRAKVFAYRKAHTRHQRAEHPLDTTEQEIDPVHLLERAQAKPGLLTHHDVLQLQRIIGNQATARMLVKPHGVAIQRGGGGSKSKNKKDKKGKIDPVRKYLLSFIGRDNDVKNLGALAAHLIQIMDAMDSDDHVKAYALLTDADFAAQFKHVIVRRKEPILGCMGEGKPKSKDVILEAVQKLAGLGMYKPGRNTLNLPDCVVFSQAATIMDTIHAPADSIWTPANDHEIGFLILPVMLEEWIHMFQYLSGDVLSEATRLFRETPEYREHSDPLSIESWDIDEVDIYAVYRDLGWEHILDDFVARYDERQAFAKFVDTLKKK